MSCQSLQGEVGGGSLTWGCIITRNWLTGWSGGGEDRERLVVGFNGIVESVFFLLRVVERGRTLRHPTCYFIIPSSKCNLEISSPAP
jgi:hypothetical protein